MELKPISQYDIIKKKRLVVLFEIVHTIIHKKVCYIEEAWIKERMTVKIKNGIF